MKNSVVISMLLMLLVPFQLQAHTAKVSSRINIAMPVNAAIVTNPVTVRFETDKVDIAAVGVRKHKTGHVLLLINAPLPDLDEPIPMDAKHIHYMQGETEAVVTLPVGENRLQVLLLDEEHEIFQEWLLSKPITIQVRQEPK